MNGKSIIGFDFIGKGKNTFQTFNPSTNTPNQTQFVEATEEEVNLAVELADKAFLQYQDKSGGEKSHFLQQISKNISNLGDELLDMYCQESGLSKNRAIAERKRTLWQLELFSKLVMDGSWVNASIDSGNPDSKTDLRKLAIPLGPVVVFGASNFPLAYSTAGGDTVSALAAGCPVIVKSHPMHAGTGELIATCIMEAAKSTGMPEGVFANLNSNSFEAGTQLVKHPLVKAVGFTGSISGGTALFKIANNRSEPIPVFAEMGSINPVLVFPKALQNRKNEIAKSLGESITLDSGQFCTNPGLIIGIEGNELDQFIKALAVEINAKQPSTMLSPQILDNFTQARNKVSIQYGLNTITDKKNDLNPNVGPAALAIASGELFIENKTLHQEVFGPFSLVVKCKDTNQMHQAISQLEGQLTGSLFVDESETSTYNKIFTALKFRVGRIIFNGVPTGVAVCKSMHHGGPFPASTDSRFTAVGHDSILRFVRPISYQNWPDHLLPKALQNVNPLHIIRNNNGVLNRNKVGELETVKEAEKPMKQPIENASSTKQKITPVKTIKTGKKRWKLIALILIGLFLIANIIALFHAWNATHFVTSTDTASVINESSGFWDKTSAVIFGVSIPKSQNEELDTDFFEVDTVFGDVNLEIWKLDMEPSKGVVLFYHGYRSSKSALWREAMAIYRMGYSVILVDFRASGNSDGNICTIGYKEAEDVKSTFDWCQDAYPSQKIYLYGTSMGAAAVMRACSELNIQPEGVILQSSFTKLNSAVKSRFNRLGFPTWPMSTLFTFWGGTINGFNAFNHNPIEYAKKINCPTLLIHGMLDNRVSWEDSQSIYENINAKKEFGVFSNSGHESILNHEEANWIYLVTNFFSTIK